MIGARVQSSIAKTPGKNESQCERDRVASNESEKFYGQPRSRGTLKHTHTHYRWTRVKASGPRLTALVSYPLASDSLAVAQWRNPPNVALHPTYPTESACASGAGVATPTQRPPKCGERADATARAWLTQKLCPSPLPSHDPSVRFSVRHMHTSHPCSSFPKPSLLERRGRGSAPNSMSPRVWRERFTGAAARAWLSCSTPDEDRS